jgi:hypothetical protein
VYSSFQPKALQEATEGWSEERKQVVRDIGLAGTLDIGKMKKLNREWTKWLLKRVDTERSELRIGVKETVPITENEIGPMLGIQSGGRKIISRGPEKPNAYQISLIRGYLGLPAHKLGITVGELIGKLQEEVDDPMT